MGPAGFKSEGEHLSPIAIPYAPAQGLGNGGIGSLFALNPDAKGGGASMPSGVPAACGLADNGFIPARLQNQSIKLTVELNSWLVLLS